MITQLSKPSGDINGKPEKTGIVRGAVLLWPNQRLRCDRYRLMVVLRYLPARAIFSGKFALGSGFKLPNRTPSKLINNFKVQYIGILK